MLSAGCSTAHAAPSGGLAVAQRDVAPHEEPEQIAVTQQFAEVERHQSARGRMITASSGQPCTRG